MSGVTHFFATAARGLEPLLVRELTALGATEAKESSGGVRFAGDLAVGYRACLWSRLASRILLPLKTIPLEGEDASEPLYRGAMEVAWGDLFDATSTFAIEVAGNAPSISHTHYAGLKVKDAIVDTFREKNGARPNVDTKDPALRIHLHLHKQQATLSLDLSGDSLHKRGYRRSSAQAPLRENLAAAILMRAGWPELATQGAPLLDPMCGSGTLVIEAGLMAADIAPGLARKRYGFEAWLDHKPALWRELKSEAQSRAKLGLAKALPVLRGTDSDPHAIHAAQDNARRAGLDGKLRFGAADLSQVRPETPQPGLLVTNPPYGERLGEEALVIKLHSLLGGVLKEHFGGWQAAVFTGRPDLGPRIGLRAKDMYSFYNGPLPCKLLLFDVAAARPAVTGDTAPTGGADFANRLGKNLKHLEKWARRKGVNCYRAYDADLPDYAVAVDVYQAAERHVHVQEYAAPKTIDPARAEKRLREALGHIQQMLDVPSSRLHYKLRRAQKGDTQYRKQSDAGVFHEVVEHGCRLRVNFDDYLDTGLFLDHRPLRLRIQQEAAGKRFLNLFCYTGTATAHAVKGGAAKTVSIDLSNTYLEWAQHNLRLNGAQASIGDGRPPPPGRQARGDSTAHPLLRADCLKWLAQQAEVGSPPQFDLILLDPPTFSNSKRMEDVLDTQRDHGLMIRQCMHLLAPGGVLYFSTNRRGFKLDAALQTEFSFKDITAQTLDEDFKRPPPAHRCWQVTSGK